MVSVVFAAFQADLVVRAVRRGMAHLLTFVALEHGFFELDSESLEVDSDSVSYDFVEGVAVSYFS